MTLAVRLIPCLDVAAGRVVKGTRFVNLRDQGDPVETAVRYEGEGADEIAFLDIAAANENRGTLVSLVSHVAEALSIPFTVGGGVRAVEDADALLRAGADRVVVNTAAVSDPELIRRLSEQFGAQCVVVAVDGQRVRGVSGEIRMVVTTHGGRRITQRGVVEWASEAAHLGAGEILLTSVDADGTREGFDLEMLRAVRGAVDVPIVASGGAGKLSHFVTAVREGGADAVLAAGVFHERVFTIEEVKLALASAGVPVRITGPAVTPPGSAAGLPVVFDESGLVPVVVRDVTTGDVLTLAYANAEALAQTRATGFSHFFSRSRKKLWKKGETSGNVQRVTAISVDCDGDAVVYDVIPEGPACHTGSHSCFRVAATLATPAARPTLDLGPLFAIILERKKNPVAGSYTNRLLEAGLSKIAKKVGEEGVETALAALVEDDDALAGEAADLLYHLAVLLTARGLSPADVEKKLRDRRGLRRPS